MDNNKIVNFTDLIVWQQAHKLVLGIYQITENFPKHELFGLSSQIRRAGISITSNIAEGFSRNSVKEKLHFYSIAHGSLTELENQLLLARDIGYLKVDEFNQLGTKLVSVHKLINAFIKSTHSRF